MKNFNTLYKGATALESFVQENNLQNEKQCLVRIHASNGNAKECVKLAKEVKNLIPEASINGCCASGIMYEGMIYDDEILITFNVFEYGRVITKRVDTEGLSSEEIVRSIFENSKDFPATLCMLFFGYLEDNIFQISKFLNQYLEGVSVVGGLAGYFLPNGSIESFVFDEDGYSKHSYIASYISQDFVLSYTNVVTGHPPISEVHTITKVHEEYIDEIDHIPAIEWINENLGIKDLTENSNWKDTVATDIFLRFPLVLEDYHCSTRFVQYEASTNAMKLYFNKMEEGLKFRIGYLSAIRGAEEWQAVCHDLQSTSVETLFFYSCLFRRFYAKNLAAWEMSAFKNNKICGAFLLGELGTKEKQVEYLNGVCSFFTMAEKENYITPDLLAFEHIEDVMEDNADVIAQIDMARSALKGAEKNLVLERLIQYENNVKHRMRLEGNLGLKSSTQFLLDNADRPADQLCMIIVQQGKRHIQKLGESQFHQLMAENLAKMKAFLKEDYSQHQFEFYSYDQGIIYFITKGRVNRETFIELCKDLYMHCGITNLMQESVVCTNDFVLTVTGNSLLQMTEYYRQNGKNSRFLLLDRQVSEEDLLQEEFELVADIREIIEAKRVVPYFQGIYDNRRNCFFAYEALMRLQDDRGKMLFPGEFMELSKKYNLYLELSRQMVLKTLELFSNREEVVTMNISALDVMDEEFQAVLFEKLASIEKTNHFIFELVETERFENHDELRFFIRKLKQYGIKIAVDDFGAGYSNFIEIGNLPIDFIKINGSLTKLLGTDSSYDQILDSISYMGHKKDVELIAEYVETAAMQKRLISSGVHYSQGYLFSKPMSFDELTVVSKENQRDSNANQVATDKDFGKFFNGKFGERKQNALFYWGGLSLAILAIICTFALTSYQQIQMSLVHESLGAKEDTLRMMGRINASTTFYLFILGGILVLYFTGIFIYTRRSRKELLDALEASYFLSNSLQASIEVDALTRCYTRSTAIEKIGDLIAGQPGFHALAIVDVNNFKEINDNYGHPTGDLYLQDFSSAIKACLRSGDILGRLGGDEFVVFLQHVENKDKIEEIFQSIFERVVEISMRDISLDNVGLSAGIVEVSKVDVTVDILFHQADQALYQAKKAGRNQFEYFKCLTED